MINPLIFEMVVFGRLVFKEFALTRDKKTKYSRIIVATEKGSEAELTKLSVFDREAQLTLANIPLRSGVRADIYESNGYKNVVGIEMVTLMSCPTCYKFSIDDHADAQKVCEGCGLDRGSERLQGVWKLKSTKDYIRDMTSLQNPKQQCENVAKKILLQQDNNLLGYVTFPNTPFFDTLSKLAVDDLLNIAAWRDLHRHTKFVDVQLEEKSEERFICEPCAKDFKTKASLKTHSSVYHLKRR